MQWLGEDGLHVVLPGQTPTPETLDEMTRIYQQKIRESPIWDEIVKELGLEQAERLLKEFRVENR